MAKGSNVGSSINFSYTTSSAAHNIYEEPVHSHLEETIPTSAFAHASTIQAAARYLVDVKGHSFKDAAKLLGRAPKSLWTSYHQAPELPALEPGLDIPTTIFHNATSPLESLVLYLKSKGLRNVEIARLLRLDPKTTWTAAKRGEGKQ